MHNFRVKRGVSARFTEYVSEWFGVLRRGLPSTRDRTAAEFSVSTPTRSTAQKHEVQLAIVDPREWPESRGWRSKRFGGNCLRELDMPDRLGITLCRRPETSSL